MQTTTQTWIVGLMAAVALLYLLKRWWPTWRSLWKTAPERPCPDGTGAGPCGTSCGQCGSSRERPIKIHRPS